VGPLTCVWPQTTASAIVHPHPHRHTIMEVQQWLAHTSAHPNLAAHASPLPPSLLQHTRYISRAVSLVRERYPNFYELNYERLRGSLYNTIEKESFLYRK